MDFAYNVALQIAMMAKLLYDSACMWRECAREAEAATAQVQSHCDGMQVCFAILHLLAMGS